MYKSANERMGPPVARGIFMVVAGLILIACVARGDVALYQNAAAWITDNTLPSERVALPAFAARYVKDRATVVLSETDDARALLMALQTTHPNVVVAWRSLAWDGVRAQPWFLDHYHMLARIESPGLAGAPLHLLGYQPSPFDEGEKQVVAVGNGVEPIPVRAVRLNHTRLTPGEPLYVTLFWADDLLPSAVYRWVLSLMDDGGETWVQFEAVLPDGLPANLRREGDDLVSHAALAVPDDLPAGDYVLALTFYRRNGAPIGVEGLHLAELFRPLEVTQERPVPDFDGTWYLGDAVTLIGYDAPGQISPGTVFRVALYWYTRDTVPGDKKVFVHLLDTDGALVAQADGKPVWWTYPTTRWEPGQYIRDEHMVTLPSSLPRGDYTLFVGMYDAETGLRLDGVDAQGAVLPDGRIELRIVKAR